MFIEDMQHSQPHMILYLEVIFLSWVGRILRKVKSLIMILLSVYTAYFSRPSSGELNRILCSSLTETWNNNFDTNFFIYHQCRRKDNIFLLEIAQPEDNVESICKRILWPVDNFLYYQGA